MRPQENASIGWVRRKHLMDTAPPGLRDNDFTNQKHLRLGVKFCVSGTASAEHDVLRRSG